VRRLYRKRKFNGEVRGRTRRVGYARQAGVKGGGGWGRRKEESRGVLEREKS